MTRGDRRFLKQVFENLFIIILLILWLISVEAYT